MNFTKPIFACSLLPPSVEHTDANILSAMQRLRYPVLATLKKDGIRALRLNGSLLSRTLKPIPNKSIRARSIVLPGGFDMELWNKDLEYHEIESIVMSREHKDSDKIEFHVLDWFLQQFHYKERLRQAYSKLCDISRLDCDMEHAIECYNSDGLFQTFLQFEKERGEGICFRTFDSPYKCGRSTLREQYLVKLSRYLTAEATIIGFIEQQENCNTVKHNAIGNMDRSSSQSRLFGKNTLGSLLVKNEIGEFSIGTGVGLDNKLRQDIWDNQDKYLGKTIVYKYKPHGQKNLPRSPIFKGFRKPELDI